MEDLVSVIVPVYNTESFLPQCLESICKQTYDKIEIILVNDGSTDRSRDICLNYAMKDSRIVYCEKENGGNTSARKCGFKQACGRYICFVDSDDWVEPDMVQKLLDNLQQYQADMVTARFFYENEAEKKTEKGGGRLEPGVYQGENYRKIFIRRMFYGNPNNGWGIWPTLWGKIFLKDALESFLLRLDEKIFYGEDAATIYPYCLAASSAVVLEDAVYHYRVRESSVSNKKNPEIFNNLCCLYDYLYTFFAAEEQREQLLEYLKYYALNLFNHALNMQTNFNGNMESIWWEKGIDNRNLVLPQYQKKIAEADSKAKKKESPYEWKSIWLFPFHLIPEGSRFVVFGSGYIGKSFVWQLKRSDKKIEFVKWLDTYGMCVKAPELGLDDIRHIGNYEYDYVVLAAANSEAEKEMRNNLIKLEVDEKKIVWEYPQRLNGILSLKGE